MDEGRGGFAQLDGEHLADEERVIADRVLGHDAALDPAERADE